MSCFLLNSSIGKKVVMSLSGLLLVLFIFFHMSMNLAAIFSDDAYNMICTLLGANWYALIATAMLAGGVAVHFAYAMILTVNNYAARGNQRYAITTTEKGVSWSSKNMLILGYIILLGLVIHLIHFWSKMQLVELMGGHHVILDGAEVSVHNGAEIIRYTFSKWYNVAIYLVWFVAIWYHLTHGVWSMCQSVGIANDTWYPRLKCIANVVATLIFLGFASVVVVTFVKSLGLCSACC